MSYIGSGVPYSKLSTRYIIRFDITAYLDPVSNPGSNSMYKGWVVKEAKVEKMLIQFKCF